MERGVYFDGWFPRQHCYHSSKPARKIKMVEDLRDYHATALVWSAMGGGSISLPYLEEEAFGAIDPRFRFYGFMNDREFVRECHKYGIKVFGIVFEAQGWEFPVELNEAEDELLALNELRGEGKPGWIGLREFTQNRYPKLWPPLESYFPRGLTNSLGEPVTDLFEECCSRDIYGNALHARWVECPDRAHECHLMDRNNPVWREYLKAIIRVQVDAGVDGIQLDEAEVPITSFQYGGCFCKDCMRGFREYLQALPADQLPEPLRGMDLSAFHYGEWLLKQGCDFQTNREDSPLFWDYLRYQRGATARTFAEMAAYAREYAASKGRTVLVSGNFFNVFDHYYAYEPHVDLMITEMRNTRYRQPEWYRYVAGFAAQKPVLVAENPYGGIVAGLIEKLKVGRGYNLFRTSIYEGAAMGVNMTIPYGSWMGSVIEDSFYAPHELCKEVTGFLYEHERLLSRATLNDTAVVYSVENNFQPICRRDLFADNRSNTSGGAPIPYEEACSALTAALQPYDVVIFPEGQLRADSLTPDDLRPYRTLILPDCRLLTPAQAELLKGYLDNGGQIVITGELGANLPAADQSALLDHPRTTRLDHTALRIEDLPGGSQARVSPQADLAINLQRVPDGAAVHIIRYDCDPETDIVPPLPELVIDLRMAQPYHSVEVFSPNGNPGVIMLPIEGDGVTIRLRIEDVPLYTVVLLKA